MDLSLKLATPDAALRKVDKLEMNRSSTANEISRLENEYSTDMALQTITEEQMRNIIEDLAEELKEKSKLTGLIA